MYKKIISFLLVAALVFTSGAVYTAKNAEQASAAGKSAYLLKVNKQKNVVTAYKRVKGRYKPYRAMLCSTGGANTPSGTHHLSRKYRWHTLMGPVWGQYCTVFCGACLFHSVWYYRNYNKSTCSGAEYNRLGTSCSHGCIRLSVMDAKWLYENCPSGTIVKIYRSSKAGPLGKPKGIKVRGRSVWDPTDPDPKNPNFRLKKPVIKILGKKAKLVRKKVNSSNRKYNIRKIAKARNINAYQSLTDKVKVSKVFKRVDGRWKRIKKRKYISRKTPGKYKIVYRVYDKYCGGASTARLIFTVKKKGKTDKRISNKVKNNTKLKLKTK